MTEPLGSTLRGLDRGIRAGQNIVHRSRAPVIRFLEGPGHHGVECPPSVLLLLQRPEAGAYDLADTVVVAALHARAMDSSSGVRCTFVAVETFMSSFDMRCALGTGNSSAVVSAVAVSRGVDRGADRDSSLVDSPAGTRSYCLHTAESVLNCISSAALTTSWG